MSSPAVKGTSVWESVSPGKSTKQEDVVLPGHNDGAKIFMQSYSNYSCFVHPIYGFWSLLATKLQKYYVIFVYILLGKMGKTEKNRKENHATKVTKIPKTKR